MRNSARPTDPALAGVFALLLLISPAAAGEKDPARAPSCDSVRKLDSRSYWELELAVGVENEREEQELRKGNLAGQPGACFEVSLRGLLSEETRAAAYLAVLSSFVGGLPGDPSRWKEMPESVSYLQKAARATGIAFLPASFGPEDIEAGARRFQEYMRGDLRHLTWSSSAGTLVKSAEAGPEGDALHVEEIDAVTFWTWDALGAISEVRDGPVERRGRFQLRSRQGLFRVALSALPDLEAHHAGYLEATNELVMRLSLSTGLAEAEKRSITDRLVQLTGERFAEPQGWLSWWVRNRDGLALSEDGKKLLVGSR
jgi:hypothetical protein